MKTRLAVLAFASLALACADNGASIQPFAICAPPDSATECSFQSTCEMVHMGPLRLDTNLTSRLIVFLQVNNQLPNNADLSSGRVNTNDAYVTEYEVEFEGPVTNTVVGKTQAVVPAGGSTIVALVIDLSLQRDPISGAVTTRGLVTAKMRLKGNYADQSEFETAAYEAPIEVDSGNVGLPFCPTGEVLKGTCPGGATGQIPLGVECEAPPTTPTTP